MTAIIKDYNDSRPNQPFL